jgi:pimeloyl-ACP methyl ester carboxylesterase
LTCGEGLAYYARFLSTLEVRPFHRDIEAAKLPVLILAPTKSRNTSLEDQQKYKEGIPGCKLVVIDGRGHEIFVDKAEECQKAVLEFVGSIGK